MENRKPVMIAKQKDTRMKMNNHEMPKMWICLGKKQMD